MGLHRVIFTDMIITAEGHKTKAAKGKMQEAIPEEKPGTSFQEPSLMEPHRTHLILPAVSIDTCGMLSFRKLIRDCVHLLWGVGHRHSA